MKLHPLFRQYLERWRDGRVGPKTIPEGGYYDHSHAPLGRWCRDPGDSAGLVDDAVAQGDPLRHAVGDVRRARHLCGLKAGDASPHGSASYDRLVNESFIMQDRVSHPETCGSRSRTVSMRRMKGGA